MLICSHCSLVMCKLVVSSAPPASSTGSHIMWEERCILLKRELACAPYILGPLAFYSKYTKTTYRGLLYFNKCKLFTIYIYVCLIYVCSLESNKWGIIAFCNLSVVHFRTWMQSDKQFRYGTDFWIRRLKNSFLWSWTKCCTSTTSRWATSDILVYRLQWRPRHLNPR